MESSKIYSINKIDENMRQGDLFIMTFDGEERGYYGWNKIIENKGQYKSVLILTYNKNILLNKINSINKIGESNYQILEILHDQIEFVNSLKKIEEINSAGNITIDISCLRTLNLFLLMKYLKTERPNSVLSIINTIPYDYIFADQPFVSYKSYLGDLELCEIIGYSGIKDLPDDRDLYIFLGFEGALSLKVVEETVYNSLFLVNTMPSYYQKYKDVSVLNNYNLLKNSKIFYVPVENPFEVYNTLEREINEERSVCIAPLGPKPVSLGICMYALEHENVRIVYPVSDIYNDIKSRDVHLSYAYEIMI